MSRFRYVPLFFALLPVVVRDVGKHLPPGAVVRVGKPGVVGVQLRPVGEDLVGEPVQVLDVLGEPGDALLVVLVLPGDDVDVLYPPLHLLEGHREPRRRKGEVRVGR